MACALSLSATRGSDLLSRVAQSYYTSSTASQCLHYCLPCGNTTPGDPDTDRLAQTALLGVRAECSGQQELAGHVPQLRNSPPGVCRPGSRRARVDGRGDLMGHGVEAVGDLGAGPRPRKAHAKRSGAAANPADLEFEAGFRCKS